MMKLDLYWGGSGSECLTILLRNFFEGDSCIFFEIDEQYNVMFIVLLNKYIISDYNKV